MTNTITLGRITLPSPDSVRQEGDQLRIAHSGYPFEGSSGLVMAQQVNGYPNTDEPVVPFRYGTDLAFAGQEQLDGFYFVESTKVDWVKLAAGLFAWEVQLTAVPGYTAPLIEVGYSEKLRPNAHSVLTASTYGWIGLPGSATAVTNGLGTIGSPSRTSLATADGGTVTLIELADPDTYWGAGGAQYLQYKVTAAYAMQGAARIETGPYFDTVAGQQIMSEPENWRVTNDLVQVYPSGASLIVGVWDSTAWETHSWTPTLYNGSNTFFMGTPETVTVLRNSPETCVVRLAYDLNGAVQFPSGGSTYTSISDSYYVDLTVRRGARWVEGMSVSQSSSTSNRMGVYRTSAQAATAITGGVEATTAVSGNKYRAYTSIAKTNDLTQGGFRASSTSLTLPWGVGTDHANSIALHYFTAAHFRQRITTA
jgi:hypothetical protein